MITAGEQSPMCRLCGMIIRADDDAALVVDELSHAPCAEPAFAGTDEWTHTQIGTINQLAMASGGLGSGRTPPRPTDD